MNKREFGMFINALKTFYPREKLLPNQEAMELWYEMLKDISYQAASKALQKWVATEKWSPTIADIRSTVSGLENETAEDWASAWQEVTRAISRCGIYRETEALESMDEITRECVKAIGWKNICNSEEIGVERGHFRTMYEQRSEKVNAAKSIPDRLRSPIESRLAEGNNNVLSMGEVLKGLTG